MGCVLICLLLSFKRTILVWQLLWIQLYQLKRMTQTPLLCFMSGDSYKTKWDSGAIKTNVCHKCLLKSGQRTHHLHWPFHTLKWELLATVPPLWVSKNSAFPDHPSVNNSVIKNTVTTLHNLYIFHFKQRTALVSIYATKACEDCAISDDIWKMLGTTHSLTSAV